MDCVWGQLHILMFEVCLLLTSEAVISRELLPTRQHWAQHALQHSRQPLCNGKMRLSTE